MKPSVKIPVSLLRGGASKALLVSSKDLPTSPSQREAMLLSLLGQGNTEGQQINGLGGGHESTSKLAIVGPSSRSDCDVDFTYGALNPKLSSAGAAKINWSESCTHTVAAVALYAVDQQWLAPPEPGPVNAGANRGAVTQSTTTPNVSNLGSMALNPIQAAQKTEILVRIWQVNVGQVIHAYVPMLGLYIDESTEVTEFGQPMRGALVRLEFFESSSSRSSPWLPTGNAKEMLALGNHGKFEVTLLGSDCPAILLRADELGLTGKETASQLTKNAQLAGRLAAIKNHVAQLIGFTTQASSLTCVLVYKAHAYQTLTAATLGEADTDLVIRVAQTDVPKQVHLQPPSDSLLFAIAVACAIPGTIAHQIARTLPGIETRIGHLNGVAAIGAQVVQTQSNLTELEQSASLKNKVSGYWVLDRAVLLRSARRLMSGSAYLY